MRKTIYFGLAITTLIAGSMLTGCQSSATKVENAQENVQEAKDDVLEAKQELNQVLMDSIRNFRKESDARITEHEKNIAEFKVRIATEKKEKREKYNKELAELERKNSDMKKKLDDYKEDGNEKWDAFKVEFNHDMDELGRAFKDLTVRNVK